MEKSANELTEIVLNDYRNEQFDSKQIVKHKKIYNFISFEKLKLLINNNFLFVSTVNILGVVVMIYFLLMLFN